jgi:prepilin-type N-terminal cleavage/methylation domain-containing protein
MKLDIRNRSRAGVTLIELMITVSILALVVTATMETIGTGTASSRSVTTGVRENADLRDSGKRISQELRSAGGGRFDVAVLGDGNHELTFQVPVTVAGVAGWGVYDRHLGGDEAAWNRVDWSLRYTVVPGNDGERLLVRQVLDDADVVQRQSTLSGDLRDGNANPAGFQVTNQGDVWEVVITTESASAIGGDAGGMKLHVHTQN